MWYHPWGPTLPDSMRRVSILAVQLLQRLELVYECFILILKHGETILQTLDVFLFLASTFPSRLTCKKSPKFNLGKFGKKNKKKKNLIYRFFKSLISLFRTVSSTTTISPVWFTLPLLKLLLLLLLLVLQLLLIPALSRSFSKCFDDDMRCIEFIVCLKWLELTPAAPKKLCSFEFDADLLAAELLIFTRFCNWVLFIFAATPVECELKLLLVGFNLNNELVLLL